MIDLSVVVPMYGCRDCLDALHGRLTATLERLTPSYEIVYVDDRSPDDSWPALLSLAAVDTCVRAIRLSRNFGQHAAITAGLEHARGRHVVVMDCDLQDPPEAIEDLYRRAQAGYDVVLARRAEHRQTIFRRLASGVYFWLRKTFLNDDAGPYSTLSILSRKVVDQFLRFQDKDRQYMLIVHWLGFERSTIELDPAPRHSGKSSYTLARLLQVAVDGIFFQTTALLRWIVYFGFVLAAAGAALAIYHFVFYFVRGAFPGWTTLVVVQLLVGGFIITSLGVTALYIGKIFEQVKGRPLYVVDAKVGLAGEEFDGTTERENAAAATHLSTG